MRRGELQAAQEEFLCPACGYDLRAIVSDNCPECGVGIDRSGVGTPHIPWEHRGHLGHWSAYWRTNVRIIRKPTLLLGGLHPRVDRRAARSFRRLSVLAGWIPLALWLIGIAIVSDEAARFSRAGLLGWCLEAACYASVVVAVYVSLARMAADNYIFYRPKDPAEQRETFAKAGCYCCAPLAWTWVPALLLLLAVVAERSHPRGALLLLPTALYRLSTFAAIAVVAGWIWCAVTLARATLKASRAESILLVIFIPIQWVSVGCVAVIIPLTAYYLSVVILSLS